MKFIKEIFEKQILLNKVIGHDLEIVKEVEESRDKYTKEFALAIHSEISEMLDWMNWKFWKKTKVDYTPERIKELHIELIDILHFWVNLCIIWDLTPEKLINLFEEKNKENFNRQERGY